jgi:hypothetical protein
MTLIPLKTPSDLALDVWLAKTEDARLDAFEMLTLHPDEERVQDPMAKLLDVLMPEGVSGALLSQYFTMCARIDQLADLKVV